MGKGYALVSRQQHIHTEDNDYYINLVFYNYLLKCFVLVDLKTRKNFVRRCWTDGYVSNVVREIKKG